MGPFTEDKVKELFLEALERPAPDRADWLEDSCSDSALRQEVLGLLRAHERAEGFLDRPDADEPGTQEGPGSTIGRYKILQEIGKGGFGVVYMAEQTEPVKRKVALKVLKLGMDTAQVVARFEAERQALALMDHPNIAKVLDGGATERGRPYFVMELVKGVPITEYCDQASVATAERLALFQDVCHAVQHAHQKGIIHRDIKPRNVLVTLHDGRAVPKVIDFGIAKAVDRELTEKTLFTEFQQIIGTPEYMAPEQAEMTSLDVDTRADIYSLGVLLYELLTGTKPFDMKRLLEEGYGEILRTIREVEPPRPSTRLSTLGDQLPVVARQRHTEPKLLGKLIRGDLDWIVMKALEKDRGRRYDTAASLADDIGRYLTDQPVVASPPSRAYRLKKYVRRNRVAVGTGVVVLAALLTGLGLAVWGWRDAAHQADVATAARAETAEQRNQARDEAAKASQILAVLEEMLASASPYEQADPDYTVRQMLHDFEHGLAPRLADRPRVEGAIRITMARTLEDLALLDDAQRNLDRARVLFEAEPAGAETRLAEIHALTGLVEVGRGHARDAEREVRRALALYEGPAASDAAGKATALTILGWALQDQGRYRDAEQRHREAEAVARSMPSDPRLVLPGILNNLGSALEAQMKYEEAEGKLREALRLYEAAHGREHPLCALCLSNLSTVLAAQGKHDDASEMARRVLVLRQAQLPEGHPLVATSLNNLGLIETQRAHYDEAQELLQQAYLLHVRNHGEEHRATTSALNNLGVLFGKRGDLARSEELLRKCLRTRRKVLRADHPLTCLTLVNLGGCLSRQDRFDEAEPMLLDAARATRRAVGPEHRQLSAALEEVATLYRRMRRFEEAEPYARQVLAMRERALGPEHPGVAQALIDHGHLLQTLGRLEESVAALERARDIALRRRGPDHPNVAVVLENLSTTLSLTKEPDRARAPLEEAHRILVKAFGQDARRALRVGLNLALLRSDLGDHASGETLIRKVLGSQGLPAPMRPSALTVLGQCLLRQARFEEAETSLREARAERRRLEPTSWLLWNTTSLLGESLLGQRKFDAAETLLLEAQQKMRPPDSSMGHLRSRQAVERIVQLYEAWGKADQAAAWRAKLENQ